MDQLTQIKAFVKVAEEGNFSAAARALKTTQPSVSKAVAELESRLGTRLLHRTTRSLKLTEAGTAYYRRMKHMLDLWASADAEAAGDGAQLEGHLRINAPGLLASGMVMPALLEFRQRFPSVSVELTVDDRRIDPVHDATDIAIRIGTLKDSTLRVRRVGTARAGFYAAPAYLERWEGRSLAGDVVELELISFPNQRTSAPVTSRLALLGGTHPLAWSSSITVNNGLQAREAALGGAGVAILPKFLTVNDEYNGQLVELKSTEKSPEMEIHMLHPYTRDLPQRVREFLDFSIDYWREKGLVSE